MTPYSTNYGSSFGYYTDISNTLTFTDFDKGAGTINAHLTRSGKFVSGFMAITLGTGFTIGTTPSFNLPYPMDDTREASGWTGSIFDQSTGDIYIISAYGISQTQIGFRATKVKGQTIEIVPITTTFPLTFASGDIITLNGNYKIAS